MQDKILRGADWQICCAAELYSAGAEISVRPGLPTLADLQIRDTAGCNPALHAEEFCPASGGGLGRFSPGAEWQYPDLNLVGAPLPRHYQNQTLPLECVDCILELGPLISARMNFSIPAE